MNTWRANGTITGAGVLSAIAASLCCISPVAALLAGGSLAANFSWIEPARPYLIGISISVLSLVWYMKLKPKEIGRLDCPCDSESKVSFLQSKAFLGIVTCLSIFVMTFPLYSKGSLPKPEVHPLSALSGGKSWR